MATPFEIHPTLIRDTWAVAEWPVSSVRLMDDARFPWLVLVPRIPGAREIHRLAPDARNALFGEMVRAAEALERFTGAAKLNIGALGNLVPQLHIHVLARNEGDAAWPGPVWGVLGREPYAEERARRWIADFCDALDRHR